MTLSTAGLSRYQAQKKGGKVERNSGAYLSNPSISIRADDRGEGGEMRARETSEIVIRVYLSGL